MAFENEDDPVFANTFQTFWMGYTDPRGAAGTQRQIAEHNSKVAARQINTARTVPKGSVGAALRATRREDPNANVRDGVRQATHRLRTIASAVERAGGDPVLYMTALTELASVTPDVDVSDIFWS